MLQARDLDPKALARRQPWPNLLEAQLKGQRRLADGKCAQAGTLEARQRFPAACLATFPTPRHGAHQERAENRRTPVDVVGWVRGRAVAPERLRHLCGRVQCLRTVPPSGFVRIQRVDIYAEPGLSRHRVAGWLSAGQRRIA
jgi:hypothetical protein